MDRESSKGNPNESSSTAYDDLDQLIDSGDEVVSSRLDDARKKNEITEGQYFKLVRKLLRKHEVIQEGLVNVSKGLEVKIDELGIDTVTGLFKHESLTQKLNALITELNFKPTPDSKVREPKLCAVIVIAVDLDNLRTWNEYGHDIGDKALKTVASCTKKATRDGDYTFRRGDRADELEVLARVEKDLTEDELRLIFQHIRDEANTGYIEIGKGKLPVTAAMGYVVLRPGESRSVEEILKAADANQLADKEPKVKIKRIEEARERLS